MELTENQKKWLEKNGFKDNGFYCFVKMVSVWVTYSINKENLSFSAYKDLTGYEVDWGIDLFDEELLEEMQQANKLKKEWEKLK